MLFIINLGELLIVTSWTRVFAGRYHNLAMHVS
ncbi:unnamed protein product [Lathyrus oleraceus]